MFAKTAAHIRSLALLRLASLSGLLLAALSGATLCAQSTQNTSSQQAEPSSGASAPTTPPSNSPDSAQEVNTRDAPTPFSVRVNLVPIRVVVRDAHGVAVPNLRQEDFRVFEDRKLQITSHFSVEVPAPPTQPLPEASSSHPAESEKAPAVLVRPVRFVALLFDDVHLPFGELARIRNIADDYVKSSFQPSDRFAVFTISGQSQTDFTDDPKQIDVALAHAQMARELSPDNADTAGTLGWVLYCKGIYRTALAQLNEASAKDGGSSTPNAAIRKYHLAMTYLKLGDRQNGLKFLQLAKNINPNLPEAKIAASLADASR